ncbi:MAG: hypothetical protein JRI25_01415 [Deltaproteobacteria bacterium]|nr:hypothetical protein [Deltaproteobacteria bacterium]
MPPVEEFAWTTVAPLQQGRIEHSATRMRDGRILIAGGEFQNGSGWAVLDTVEVFAPTARSWSAAAPMNDARSGHTATLLASGKVMMVGGQGGTAVNKVPLASVEVYTPHSNRWTHIAPLHQARFGHTATELVDGRVLVVGGVGPEGLAGTEIFDSRTGRWTPAAPLREQRRGHIAVTLPDQRVLVAGGLGEEGVLDSVEMYDPGSNKWIEAPDMIAGRDGHDAVVLEDGSVLVVGGYQLLGFSEVELGSSEVYSPFRNEWRPAGDLASARRGHTLITLDSGQVLAVGGAFLMHTVGIPEVYTPTGRDWKSLAPVPEKLYGATTTLASPGQVLVVGGWNQYDLHSEVAMVFEATLQ